MTTRPRRAWTQVAVGLWVVVVVLSVAAPVLGELAWRLPGLPPDAAGDVAPTGNVISGLVTLLVGSLGALIAVRRPGNRVGLLLLGEAVSFGVIFATIGYSALSWYGSPGPPGGDAVAWLRSAVCHLFTFPLAALLLLLFPDGRPPSQRWNVLLWVLAALWLVRLPSDLFGEGALFLDPQVANPFAVVPAAVRAPLEGAGAALLGGLVLGSLPAPLVRFRRARGVERQQLKWLGLGAAAVALGIALTTAAPALGLGGWPGELLANAYLLSLLALPVAIAVALLRYRLYDIDRLVNRTVVYAVLTALLGATYAVVVTGAEALTAPLTGGSDLAVAASTLVVAALFSPLRARVQLAVDRRFNRRRLDTATALARYREQVRDDVDLDHLSAGLVAVAQHTLQPAAAFLWLREPGSGPRRPQGDPLGGSRPAVGVHQ